MREYDPDDPEYGPDPEYGIFGDNLTYIPEDYREYGQKRIHRKGKTDKSNISRDFNSHMIYLFNNQSKN